MGFEDLIIEKSKIAERTKLIEQRLAALRNSKASSEVQKVSDNRHRMEQVTTFRGVCFIDDSKSENINSTYFSLEQVQNKIVWLIVGEDNTTDYSQLLPMVVGKVKAVVCMGENRKEIMSVFSGHVPVILECGDMETAVRQSFYAAQKNDVVLLSTACRAGKVYENYFQRGNSFKKAIAQL